MSTPDPTDPQAARDAATADHLMAALEAQFGERLDDAARAQIRQQFAGIVAQGRALADYPPDPATEPDFVFTAPRPD